MKTRFALLVTPLLLLFAVACSDNPAASKLGVPRGASFSVPLSGDLNQDILNILALLPRGLETAATTRWGNVKAKYVAGLTDPSQMAVAKQMLFELSAWVTMKGPNMDPPPFGESKTSAATRAVLYMSLYIFNGQTASPPDGYFSGADAVVGLVTPGAAATVVTPTAHAGVAFEAGSVAENTIVVVSQNNSADFSPNCTGPLHTLLCQYPQFYTFEQFPHTRLLKGATFSVCHINAGSNRAPLGLPDVHIHDRFRLAHDKPANPADYTPGSTIRDQNGESIEILPLITQSFTHCDDVEYTPEAPVITQALTRMGRALASLLTPKSAYAIDQGGGGVSFFFSNFNDVDPVGRPDRAVQSFTAAPLCGDCTIEPGTVMVLNYTIANIGFAATGDGVPGIIQLIPDGEGATTLIGGFGVGQLYPGGPPFVMTDQQVTIPDVPAGNYTIKLTVGIGFFNEIPADLNNNSASIPITIGTVIN